MTPVLTVNVVVVPLEDPHAEWCDEHLLPCRVVQRFAFEMVLSNGTSTPHGVYVAEVHR